jgi:hypothetical protein
MVRDKPGALDRAHRFHREIERRLDLVPQIVRHDLHQLQRRLTRPKLEKMSGSIGQVDDFVPVVDDQRRRRIVLQQTLMELAERHGAPAGGRRIVDVALRLHPRQRRERQPHARARPRDEQAVRLVDDGESVVSLLDRFRHAKQHVAFGPQREVQQIENLRLRVPRQVDQEIAARDEVDAARTEDPG